MNRAAVGSVVIESGCVFGGGAVINRRWWLLILLLIGGALGVRLAWTVAVSELGWRPLRDQWTIVARSLIGLDNTPLKDRDPAQQAEFWLSEVARVTAAGDDPQAAMGAAWMLDAPQFGFIQHHIRMKDGPDVPGLPASWRRELDHQAIDALVDEFETRCREECLARIETAVRLDESDVELQRSRALLLFQAGFMSLRSEPRRADWLDVLDECAVRDPENALYDYLAVVPLWTSAAHYDYDAEVDGYVLTITDEEMFRQGDARFAAGLARPHLKFGMQVHAATFAFLDESSVLRAEHVEAAGSRLIDSRVTQLLYLVLMRWQHVRKDVAARAGRIEEAAGAVRSVLRIADQITEDGNSPNFCDSRLMLRSWGLGTLQRLQEDHPGVLSAEEAEQVAADLAAVRVELKVLEEVGRRMAAAAGEAGSADGDRSVSQSILAAIVMVAAQELVVVTLCLLSAAWLAARLAGAPPEGEPVRMGWFPHALAWLAGAGVSFVLLGVFPTAAWPEAERLQITAEELENAMRLGDSKWAWWFIQWQTRHGAVVATLAAVLLLLAWHLFRHVRRTEGGLRGLLRSRKRESVRLAGDAVVASCFAALLVGVLCYLGAAPAVAGAMEQRHRVYYDRMLNPPRVWDELAEVSEQVRSDEQLMLRFQAEIDERNREIAEQQALGEE